MSQGMDSTGKMESEGGPMSILTRISKMGPDASELHVPRALRSKKLKPIDTKGTWPVRTKK